MRMVPRERDRREHILCRVAWLQGNALPAYRLSLSRPSPGGIGRARWGTDEGDCTCICAVCLPGLTLRDPEGAKGPLGPRSALRLLWSQNGLLPGRTFCVPFWPDGAGPRGCQKAPTVVVVRMAMTAGGVLLLLCLAKASALPLKVSRNFAD